MSTRTRILPAVGLMLATAMNAAAQDVSPPPGFAPAAPPAAAPNGGPGGGSGGSPGFLQRLGGYSAPQQTSGQQDTFLNQDDPYSAPSPTDTYSPSSSGMAPAPTYSGGGFGPSQMQPVFPPPTVYAPRFWFKAEALYWWTKSSPLPVPVVTTTQGDPNAPNAGAIGQPGTSVLIGNQSIGLPGRGGGRFTLGLALDQEAIWAFETNYFFLAGVSVSQGVSSDGTPGSAGLYLPYFNTVTGTESSTFIADPPFFGGTAVVTLQSFVQGAEANVLFNMSNAGGWRWDGLAGFRYLNLHETLTFTTGSPPGDFDTFDRFDAQNNFFGGQIGARATYENPWLFFNGTAKLALGGTMETVTTSGSLFSSGGSAAGGYLTQPSNLGSMSQGQFAVIPGADLNFGVRLSPWASVTVGYSFMYVSSVARPGDQIDHAINPLQSPLAFGPTPPGTGTNNPALVVRDTDFWVQGLTFSLQLQY